MKVKVVTVGEMEEDVDFRQVVTAKSVGSEFRLQDRCHFGTIVGVIWPTDIENHHFFGWSRFVRRSKSSTSLIRPKLEF